MRIVLLAAALIAAPAFADTPAPALPVESPSPAAAAKIASVAVTPTNKRERMVCKSFYEPGSRVRAKKTCRTPAEWADLQSQTRLKIQEMQRMGSMSR